MRGRLGEPSNMERSDASTRGFMFSRLPPSLADCPLSPPDEIAIKSEITVHQADLTGRPRARLTNLNSMRSSPLARPSLYQWSCIRPMPLLMAPSFPHREEGSYVGLLRTTFTDLGLSSRPPSAMSVYEFHLPEPPQQSVLSYGFARKMSFCGCSTLDLTIERRRKRWDVAVDLSCYKRSNLERHDKHHILLNQQRIEIREARRQLDLKVCIKHPLWRIGVQVPWFHPTPAHRYYHAKRILCT